MSRFLQELFDACLRMDFFFHSLLTIVVAVFSVLMMSTEVNYSFPRIFVKALVQESKTLMQITPLMLLFQRFFKEELHLWQHPKNFYGLITSRGQLFRVPVSLNANWNPSNIIRFSFLVISETHFISAFVLNLRFTAWK